MEKKVFIQFGSFIINKDDIIFCKKSHENKEITVELRFGQTTRSVTMKFQHDYQLDDAMDKLCVDTQSITIDHYNSSFEKIIFAIRASIFSLQELIQEQTKKITTLSKEIKKQRQKPEEVVK